MNIDLDKYEIRLLIELLEEEIILGEIDIDNYIEQNDENKACGNEPYKLDIELNKLKDLYYTYQLIANKFKDIIKYIK